MACRYVLLSFCEPVRVEGSGGTLEPVMAEYFGETCVVQKPREEVVVAVFEGLAVDGGVLAALDEDEARLPAQEVLKHGVAL